MTCVILEEIGETNFHWQSPKSEKNQKGHSKTPPIHFLEGVGPYFSTPKLSFPHIKAGIAKLAPQGRVSFFFLSMFPFILEQNPLGYMIFRRFVRHVFFFFFKKNFSPDFTTPYSFESMYFGF